MAFRRHCHLMERGQVNLFLTGLNHKTAPVSLREKIAFRPDDLPKALQIIRTEPEIRESVILSTCNRTEIYAVAHTSEMNGFFSDYLSRFHQLPSAVLTPHLYQKAGFDAARHLFWVTAGLDSLVLGENQILGQVKQFYRIAQEERSLGTFLHRLFQRAIEAGKRIRHETALGENPSSVGEAAVELANHIFGDLKTKTVLVLGIGKMGQLVMDTLIESGVSNLLLCNRTFEKAQQLAQTVHGIAYSLEDLEKALLKANILIASSDTPVPLLSKQRLESIMRERRNAPLFIIDIAVPRNVEESAGRLENVFLYNVDDLQKIVAKSNQMAQKEMTKAHEILEEELGKFKTWQEALDIVPTIKQLALQMDAIKEQELQKILSKFPQFKGKDRAALELLAHNLVNKILHRPMVELKAYADHPLKIDYLEVAQTLFGLNDRKDPG